MDLKLVLIEWVDSHGSLDGWKHLDDDELQAFPLICRSVGFLVDDNKEWKKIIPHLAGEGDNFQGRGDMTIPARAIISVKELVP